MISVKKRIIAQNMEYPYAVKTVSSADGMKVFTATELDGLCLKYSDDGKVEETVWASLGGTMNICPIREDCEFLAIQKFYRGFNGLESLIAHVEKKNGIWTSKPYIRLPFIHRCCVVESVKKRYILVCQLCQNKKDVDDWSFAGSVYISEIDGNWDKTPELRLLIPGIHKNHGLLHHTLNGEEVVMISGTEGLFAIHIPQTDEEEWTVRKLIEREISDMCVADIDGDGTDELITIEGFHGATLAVNKLVGGEWEIVYTYPAQFLHALWGGMIFDKPGILVGYRGLNAALLYMHCSGEKDGELMMDVQLIDEHEGPTNIDVLHEKDKMKIFACSGAKKRVMMYELKKNEAYP